jgi:hypothetical protein|tara:strand:- start:413 stop:604 length:192 start_codon:yes stop_codon:yes gene_type:complete
MEGNNLDSLLRAYAMQYEEPIKEKDPNDLAAPARIVGMERKFLFDGKDREALKKKFLELVNNL